LHGDGCLPLLRNFEAIISAAVIYLRWSSITQMNFLLISPHNPRQIVIRDTVSGVRFRSIQPINPLRLHNLGNGPTKLLRLPRKLRAGPRCGEPPSPRLTALIYPDLRKIEHQLPFFRRMLGRWIRFAAPQFLLVCRRSSDPGSAHEIIGSLMLQCLRGETTDSVILPAERLN